MEKFVFEKQYLCSPLFGVHTVPGTIISLVCDNTKHKELVGDNTNHRDPVSNLNTQYSILNSHYSILKNLLPTLKKGNFAT